MITAMSHVYNFRVPAWERKWDKASPTEYSDGDRHFEKSARFIKYSHDELNDKYLKVTHGYCNNENSLTIVPKIACLSNPFHLQT